VAYPGLQSLDLTGPLEVFHAAHCMIGARGTRTPGYELSVLSRGGAPVRTTSGLCIVPDGALDSAPARPDTLLVPGGEGQARACEDSELIEWIARASARARRTVSVCTGAFLLARAGVLRGRRATTHWTAASALAAAYPDVDVDADSIYIRDGSVWTSAGVTAGMDLALALVEEDHDRDLALAIARQLVMFLRRPGGQSQFSATLGSQQPAREHLRELQRAVLEDVAGDHRVESLAERAHMSPRHFARAFRAETGVTPARYVQRVRLEAARRLLEDTQDPIGLIASQCGFGTAETMRRVFIRSLGVGPGEYRRRFAPAAAPAQAPYPMQAAGAREQRRTGAQRAPQERHTTTRR